MLEILINQETDDCNEDKEQYNLEQYHADLYIRIGEAGDNGQDDDTEDIVNDGRTQDGGADSALQLAQLTQSLNGDAD